MHKFVGVLDNPQIFPTLIDVSQKYFLIWEVLGALFYPQSQVSSAVHGGIK